MTRLRKIGIAYLAAMLLERAMAYALLRFDAAGHLLSAGPHTPLPVFAAVAFFVILRVLVWTSLPVAILAALLVGMRKLRKTPDRRDARE